MTHSFLDLHYWRPVDRCVGDFSGTLQFPPQLAGNDIVSVSSKENKEI